MNVIELNEGRKVEYELRGTKLDFADGTLTMNLAKYQRDYPVTKTITGVLSLSHALRMSV